MKKHSSEKKPRKKFTKKYFVNLEIRLDDGHTWIDKKISVTLKNHIPNDIYEESLRIRNCVYSWLRKHKEFEVCVTIEVYKDKTRIYEL
jgi:hypothetical protein